MAPVNGGRIVLREPAADEVQAGEGEAAKAPSFPIYSDIAPASRGDMS